MLLHRQLSVFVIQSIVFPNACFCNFKAFNFANNGCILKRLIFLLSKYIHILKSNNFQSHEGGREGGSDGGSPVTRAVHGLEGERLLLHLEGEHVLAVVLPVSWGLPQLAVVDVGRHHLLEAPLAVLALRKKSPGCFSAAAPRGSAAERDCGRRRYNLQVPRLLHAVILQTAPFGARAFAHCSHPVFFLFIN